MANIASARFGAAACAHATAAAAWACRRSEGRPFLDAARASLADCAQELGLSGRARECAGVALDALHAALYDDAGCVVGSGVIARPSSSS